MLTEFLTSQGEIVSGKGRWRSADAVFELWLNKQPGNYAVKV